MVQSCLFDLYLKEFQCILVVFKIQTSRFQGFLKKIDDIGITGPKFHRAALRQMAVHGEQAQVHSLTQPPPLLDGLSVRSVLHLPASETPFSQSPIRQPAF